MDKKSEIEFLMKLRKSAQEMVDNITLRIVELQNDKVADKHKVADKQIGFKNDGEKKEDIQNNRD